VSRTALREVTELLYDGDLPGDVARMVEDGMSWREVAARVQARTGRGISHESLRRWYGQPDEEAS